MITFSRLVRLASVTLSVTVIAAGLTASAASAGQAGAVRPLATTWTVSPGGSFTGVATTSTLQDTVSGATITCKSANIAGALKSGTGLPGKGLGKITSLTFGSCVLNGMPLSMASGTVDWPLNATSYNATSGGRAYGTITSIHFSLSSANCSAVVDGTGPAADNGKAKFTFLDKTSHLKILPASGGLSLWNVVGCGGLLGSGDAAAPGTCPNVKPPQVITGGGGEPGRRMTGPPCR